MLRLQHVKLAAAFDGFLEMTSTARARHEVAQRTVMRLKHRQLAGALDSWHATTVAFKKRHKRSVLGAARRRRSKLADAFEFFKNAAIDCKERRAVNFRLGARLRLSQLAGAFDGLCATVQLIKVQRQVVARTVSKLQQRDTCDMFSRWVMFVDDQRLQASSRAKKLLKRALELWAIYVDDKRQETSEQDASVLQSRLSDALRQGQEASLACDRAQEEAEAARRETEATRLLLEQESERDAENEKEKAGLLQKQIDMAQQEAQDARLAHQTAKQEAQDAKAQIEELTLLVEEAERERESEKDSLLEQFEKENRRAAEMAAMVQKLCMEKQLQDTSDAKERVVQEAALAQEREQMRTALLAKEQELAREREARQASEQGAQGRSDGAAARLSKDSSRRIEELERHNDDLHAAWHSLQQQIEAGDGPSDEAEAIRDEALSAALQRAEKEAREKEMLRQELETILSLLESLSQANDAWLLQHSAGGTQPAKSADNDAYVSLGLPPRGRASLRVVRTPIQSQDKDRWQVPMLQDESTVVLGSVIKGDLVPVSSAYKQPRALITPPSSRGSSLSSCGTDQLLMTPSSRRLSSVRPMQLMASLGDLSFRSSGRKRRSSASMASSTPSSTKSLSPSASAHRTALPTALDPALRAAQPDLPPPTPPSPSASSPPRHHIRPDRADTLQDDSPLPPPPPISAPLSLPSSPSASEARTALRHMDPNGGFRRGADAAAVKSPTRYVRVASLLPLSIGLSCPYQ